MKNKTRTNMHKLRTEIHVKMKIVEGNGNLR
jgi:hypothetical protein